MILAVFGLSFVLTSHFPLSPSGAPPDLRRWLTPVHAQNFGPVTGNAYAATVNCSTVTATTCTLPAVGNFNIYVTNIDIQNCASGGAVTAAAVTSITVANLMSGTTPVWTVGSGLAQGSCQPTQTIAWPTGAKSLVAGTAVVFTVPTFATNQVIRFNAYAYYAQ